MIPAGLIALAPYGPSATDEAGLLDGLALAGADLSAIFLRDDPRPDNSDIPDGHDRCRARQPVAGFRCGAAPGHSGDHAAYGTEFGRPLATWPQDGAR